MAQQGVQQTQHGIQPDRRIGHESRQSIPEQTQVIAPPSQLAQRMAQSPQQLGTRDVAYLQRAIGNQAVAHLLKPPSADTASPRLQAKLSVGPAHDRYEAEADRVAQSISDAPVQRASASSTLTSSPPLRSTPKSKAQRASDPQALAPIGPEGGAVDAETGQTIRRAQGGGRPLDAQLRAPLEQKLNTDLSHARLHVNRQADDLNQRVGARAFTTGADIFVQRSEYQPHSKAGRSLLYHELTHVHQQTGGVQRDVIQRGISTKAAAISGKLDQTYTTTTKGRAANKESQDYLGQFQNKPQDAQARKAQKSEKKQMKSLLHFGEKNKKTSDSNRRLMFRSVLAAERARGQNMAALAELKEFMILRGDNITDQNYVGLLNSTRSDVLALLKIARANDASPNLVNLFQSHNTALISELDKKITSMSIGVPKLAQEAAQLAGTSTKPAIIRLKPMSKEMQAALASTQAARNNNDFVQATQQIKTVTMLYETIWQLKTYGEMGAKSNYSSEKEIGESKRLGGGQVGKVFEVNYDPNANTSIQHGVFKQEKQDYKESESPAAGAAGIDQAEANFGSRSVASYKLDKLMGLGVTPKTKFGTHEGMGGTVQDWAKGKSPQELVKDNTTMSGVDTRFRKFDYSDPEFQRQLATLQIFDAITGQVDRHPGNYYISQGPGGTQVTAIDNDLAFGKDKDIERLSKLSEPTEKLDNDHSRGIPLFLDESIAEQILNTSDNDLKATIAGMLTPAEVSKTMVRFAKVKTELRRKKANTARIKMMQKKLEVLTKYEGRFGSSHAGVEDAMGTQIDFLRRELAKAYGKGALIDKSGWGQMTATYLNSENSYYGLLVQSARTHEEKGKMLPDGQ